MKERTVTLAWVVLAVAAVSCRGEQPTPGPSGAPVSMPAQPAAKAKGNAHAQAHAQAHGVEERRVLGEKEWAVACNFAVDLLKDETERRFAEQFAQASGEDKAVLERTRKGMMGELDQAVGKCLGRLRGMDEARARQATKCLTDSRNIKELKACDHLMRAAEPGETPSN